MNVFRRWWRHVYIEGSIAKLETARLEVLKHYGEIEDYRVYDINWFGILLGRKLNMKVEIMPNKANQHWQKIRSAYEYPMRSERRLPENVEEFL